MKIDKISKFRWFCRVFFFTNTVYVSDIWKNNFNGRHHCQLIQNRLLSAVVYQKVNCNKNLKRKCWFWWWRLLNLRQLVLENIRTDSYASLCNDIILSCFVWNEMFSLNLKIDQYLHHCFILLISNIYALGYLFNKMQKLLVQQYRKN